MSTPVGRGVRRSADPTFSIAAVGSRPRPVVGQVLTLGSLEAYVVLAPLAKGECGLTLAIGLIAALVVGVVQIYKFNYRCISK